MHDHLRIGRCGNFSARDVCALRLFSARNVSSLLYALLYALLHFRPPATTPALHLGIMSAPTSFSAPLTSNSGPNTLDGVDPSLAQDGLGNTSEQAEPLNEVERAVAEANEKLWVIIGRRLVDEKDEDEVWHKVVRTFLHSLPTHLTQYLQRDAVLDLMVPSRLCYSLLTNSPSGS